MSLIYLSDNEIDNACLSVISYIKKNYYYYFPHVMIMYLFGCRIGELFNYHISFDGVTGHVLIQPQKKNNLRILPLTNIDVPKYIEEIELTQDNFWINKRNLQRIIEKAMPYSALYCGDKKIGAHLFRHNYIRKLFASGYQIESINNIMGYTTQNVADTYLAAVIYYKT